MKRRFKLTISYDGRTFDGWQSQPGGNTIQDLLLHALTNVQEGVKSVHGSGRTDAGVHAIGQVAHFDAPEGSRMNAEAWLKAVNTKLPRTIRVMDSEEVSPDFHARFHAVGKTYRYRIYTGQVLSPFHAGLAWQIRRNLDWNVFDEVSRQFQGRHDFAAFAANRGNAEDNPVDTHRTIFQVHRQDADEFVDVFLHGEGFLYKMVRLMIGAAVKCADGGLSMDEFQRLLNQPGAEKSPLAAPADGLTLMSVDYPPVTEEP